MIAAGAVIGRGNLDRGMTIEPGEGVGESDRQVRQDRRAVACPGEPAAGLEQQLRRDHVGRGRQINGAAPSRVRRVQRGLDRGGVVTDAVALGPVGLDVGEVAHADQRGERDPLVRPGRTERRIVDVEDLDLVVRVVCGIQGQG